jgi:hypothetical protein
MRRNIDEIVAKAREDEIKHLNQPEYAFVNRFAAPAVYEHMGTIEASDERKRKALLSEFFRHMPEYHCDSPRRQLRHPFEKVPRDAPDVLKRWRGEECDKKGIARSPLHQPCPDLAIGEPFPHRIVFEVKYFVHGNAERQLVDGIYEAFYYLAMPRLPASKSHPAWHYDFGCFLAFDASPNGDLHQAWLSLSEAARNGFWTGGNLFIMIVRPQESNKG